MPEHPSIPPTLVPEADRVPSPPSDTPSPTGAAGSSCVPAPDTLSDPVLRLHDPDAAPNLTGKPVALAGRYELLGEVGRGGMGVVLRGRDPHLGRDLALKVLLEEGAGRPDVVQRFREEAQIGGQLQHPGVVPVYELGRFDDGRPFFTMKLVKGVTLAKLLKERSSPAQDRPRFLKIFEQVCQAVAFAHSRSVIHRDLKPSNVMVGAFGEVQVMDWGLAKVLSRAPGQERPAPKEAEAPSLTVVRVLRSNADSTVTQEGEVLGTPAYMPPEQALGEIDRLDVRCDVFSLGAILCEVLTGKPPYVASNTEAAMRLAQRADLRDADGRLAASDADAELIGLTRRCLAADRADRPRDGGEVARAVESYLTGVEERARRAEVERAAAEVRAAGERRARRLTLGLGASLLLLLVAGGGGGWLLQQQRAAAAALQREAEQAALTRRRETDQEVRLTLDRARMLLDEGWRAGDSSGLAAAGAEADKAVGVARRAGASKMIRDEADALLREAQTKTQQAKDNAALLAALLNVGTPRETKRYERDKTGHMAELAEPSMNEQFAVAFHGWGFDLDRTPLEEVAARMEAQPPSVLQEIVAGLETWVLERRRNAPHASDWSRLLRLVDRLDRDPQRQELRELLVSGRLRREWIVGELTKVLVPWSGLAGTDECGSQKLLKDLVTRFDPSREPILAVLLLVRALRVVGDERAAEQVLRSSVTARPDQVVLLEELGTLLQRQKRWGEAVECHRAARAVRPSLGLSLSRALAEAGRNAETETLLRELLRRSPDNPMIHFHLAWSLYHQKKLEEALAACQKALDLRPDFAEPYNLIGLIRKGQKKLDEAVTAFRKAVKLSPQFFSAQYNLGQTLVAQQRLNEAVFAFSLVDQFTRSNDSNTRAALRRIERLFDLEEQFPDILAGKKKPAGAQEKLHFADFMRYKERYRAAASFFAEAFADPKMTEDMQAGHRYDAVCCAVLAAAGTGEDAGGLDDTERARLRRQALDWFQAHLAACTRLADNGREDRLRVQNRFIHWQQDDDLASVRGDKALAALPATERAGWQKFWADAAALRKKLEDRD